MDNQLLENEDVEDGDDGNDLDYIENANAESDNTTKVKNPTSKYKIKRKISFQTDLGHGSSLQH